MSKMPGGKVRTNKQWQQYWTMTLNKVVAVHWEMRTIRELTWMSVNLNDLLANSFIESKGGIKDEPEKLSLDNWNDCEQNTDQEINEKDVFEREWCGHSKQSSNDYSITHATL